MMRILPLFLVLAAATGCGSDAPASTSYTKVEITNFVVPTNPDTANVQQWALGLPVERGGDMAYYDLQYASANQPITGASADGWGYVFVERVVQNPRFYQVNSYWEVYGAIELSSGNVVVNQARGFETNWYGGSVLTSVPLQMAWIAEPVTYHGTF